MNKHQRKTLEKLAFQLEDIMHEIECMKDDEEDKLNNMPENLQGGEKYAKIEESVGFLYDSVFDLQSTIDNLRSAIE